MHRNAFCLQIILGEVVARKAEVDQTLAKELVELGKDLPFKVVGGKTVCTNDFYEGFMNITFIMLPVKK